MAEMYNSGIGEFLLMAILIGLFKVKEWREKRNSAAGTAEHKKISSGLIISNDGAKRKENDLWN